MITESLLDKLSWAFHRSSDVSLHTMVLVFALLLLSGALAALTRGRWTSALSWLAMFALSLAWFQVNHRWEGDVLFVVSASHGLTEADLLVPAVISMALGIRLLRWAFTPISRPVGGSVSGAVSSVAREPAK
jgi:hypothetical protein